VSVRQQPRGRGGDGDGAPEFILQVAGDRHLLHAVDPLRHRFLLHRYWRVLSPFLKGRLAEKYGKETVILDHGVVSIRASAGIGRWNDGRRGHYKVDTPC
jgi:hypothetical protein